MYTWRVSLFHPCTPLIAAFWVPKKGDQELWRELPTKNISQTSGGGCHGTVCSRPSCCRLSWNWLSDMMGFFFLLAWSWKPEQQELVVLFFRLPSRLPGCGSEASIQLHSTAGCSKYKFPHPKGLHGIKIFPFWFCHLIKMPESRHIVNVPWSELMISLRVEVDPQCCSCRNKD